MELRCSNFEQPEMMTSLKKILAVKHALRYLFLELTRYCNLQCLHCGSSCPGNRDIDTIETNALIHVIDSIADTYSPAQLMFCITGGEPLLRTDWFEICSHISQRGFSWGMTTNGTLINRDCAYRLKIAGMQTVGVSLDGLKNTHEALRKVPGCFKAAITGIENLVNIRAFRSVQVTTVVSSLNIDQLDAMYALVCSLGVDSWKLTSVEPIGNARKHTTLLLSSDQHKRLFEFISEKRADGQMEVTYGCSHLLPREYDTAVRDYPFLCGAGTMIASIGSNGDILPCLDIDRRELVRQGNIRCDDFIYVWETKFNIFRENKSYHCSTCQGCTDIEVCWGDSWHTWDFDNERPVFCKKHME